MHHLGRNLVLSFQLLGSFIHLRQKVNDVCLEFSISFLQERIRHVCILNDAHAKGTRSPSGWGSSAFTFCLPEVTCWHVLDVAMSRSSKYSCIVLFYSGTSNFLVPLMNQSPWFRGTRCRALPVVCSKLLENESVSSHWQKLATVCSRGVASSGWGCKRRIVLLFCLMVQPTCSNRAGSATVPCSKHQIPSSRFIWCCDLGLWIACTSV